SCNAVCCAAASCSIERLAGSIRTLPRLAHSRFMGDSDVASRGVPARAFGIQCRHASRPGGCSVKLRLGYELLYRCPQPTPMILNLNIHYTRAADLSR